jgi:predicted transcriptional regulator
VTDKTKIIKMSVNLPDNIVQVLKELAAKRNTTMTEVLRHAIGTEKFIEEVQEAGGQVLVEDKQGKIQLVIFR